MAGRMVEFQSNGANARGYLSAPEVYDAEAAADAWRRTVEFLRRHLGRQEG